MDCFSLVCDSCSLCHGLFALPLGVIGRLYSSTVAILGHLQCHFLPVTLKAPRKTASENVVCLCRLLNILADFLKIFLHTGKQCGP